MNKHPETIAADILTLLMPSGRTIRFLEMTFAAKQKRGEVIPERDLLWLERVKRLRNNLPEEVDEIPDETWIELERMLYATNT